MIFMQKWSAKLRKVEKHHALKGHVTKVSRFKVECHIMINSILTWKCLLTVVSHITLDGPQAVECHLRV